MLVAVVVGLILDGSGGLWGWWWWVVGMVLWVLNFILNFYFIIL